MDGPAPNGNWTGGQWHWNGLMDRGLGTQREVVGIKEFSTRDLGFAWSGRIKKGYYGDYLNNRELYGGFQNKGKVYNFFDKVAKKNIENNFFLFLFMYHDTLYTNFFFMQ